MGRRCIIPDSPEFAGLWDSDLTVIAIAKIYGTSDKVVSAAAHRYGLPKRRQWRAARAQRAQAPAKQAAELSGGTEVDPMLACIERLSRARTAGEISTPPFWTRDRDVAVLATGGSYAAQCEIAFEFDVDYTAVIARWHILRKVARI